jgi:hypothetical protein
MSDFTKPVTTDTYATVLSEITSMWASIALNFDPAHDSSVNFPTNSIRYTSANKRWEINTGTPSSPVWVSNEPSGGYAIDISGNAGSASSVPWSGITSKPTTIAGYGITDIATTYAPMASGTRVGFQQSTAPTGWTQDTTTSGLNDSIMRIVTGTPSSGGSTAFSTWNTSGSTGAYTLTIADIPAHNHPLTDPGHDHLLHYTVNYQVPGGTVNAAGLGNGYSGSSDTGITMGNTGGGGGHSHPLTNNVKYFDFLIGVKN